LPVSAPALLPMCARARSTGLSGRRSGPAWCARIAAAHNLHGQRPLRRVGFKAGLVPTTQRRYASRHREWRASRSFPGPRLPNARHSYSAEAQQHTAPDLRPFSGFGRSSVQRSREAFPAAQPLCPATAGVSDANVSQGRLSERGRHCYPGLTEILASPVGSPEIARSAGPAAPCSRRPRPARAIDTHRCMRERRLA
jgi:hypothetical protein